MIRLAFQERYINFLRRRDGAWGPGGHTYVKIKKHKLVQNTKDTDINWGGRSGSEEWWTDQKNV